MEALYDNKISENPAFVFVKGVNIRIQLSLLLKASTCSKNLNVLSMFSLSAIFGATRIHFYVKMALIRFSESYVL